MATNETDYDLPDDWFNAGYQLGLDRVGLGTACALVMDEYERLEPWQWTSLVNGWHQANMDLTTYRIDMEEGVCPF